ncbi:MAG TPA: glycosyltransferase [Planktothrix sp.]|jgi:UDP-N-acetylglucosamine:LPS N-acetylglucosamine transferase
MANYKIGLIFSDTGGGHRSAVDAVDAALRELITCEPRNHTFELTSDNVVEKTHPVNQAFVDFYNSLLRNNNQRWMKYYYNFIEVIRPNDSEIGYKLSAPYIKKWLTEVNPDVLVSVHPMCNQYFVRALKELGMLGKTKFVTIVTDPNGEFWRGWACPDANVTCVPNELGKKQLIEWGVRAERIFVSGMPVNPDFTKAPSVSKAEFRNHLGLHADRLTVCINGGWAGGGNMLSIYRELGRVRRQVQAIFLCGHNRSFYEQAKKEAKHSPIPTAVLPFHDRMSDLMAAVDLMVTKAGGLTTFEAIARRLPMAIDMVTKPMPQEAGTVKIICEQGLGFGIQKPSDIIQIVETLEPVPNREAVVLPTAYSLDQVNAVHNIARSVLGLCDPVYSSALPISVTESH